jgi:hypothetical protein
LSWFIALVQMQEYLLLNKVVLEVIVSIGAAGATLSKAALA